MFIERALQSRSLTYQCRLPGMTYRDVLIIYGLSRAGYVPQLFSIRLPNPEVVLELLTMAGAKALIYDSQFQSTTSSFPLPVHLAIEKGDMTSFKYDLPPIRSTSNPDKLVFIFHTSGSTSGSPKLVPCNSRWLDAIIAKAKVTTAPLDPRRQDVSVWLYVLYHPSIIIPH
jgi:acyl-CoA synthetase (AMP-forming)/AMP-acid ligase II